MKNRPGGQYQFAPFFVCLEVFFLCFCFCLFFTLKCDTLLSVAPQWGAADAEIKVPSDENTELKGSPFKAWSRPVYCHACCAYCHGFLSCYFLPSGPFTCIFFQNLSQVFPVLAAANTGSYVGPQNDIGHPVGCRFPYLVPAQYKQTQKTYDLWCNDL